MATRRQSRQQQAEKERAEGTERLSQLSDIVSLSQAPELGSQPGALDAAPLLSSQGLAQELDQALPSQPLLPTPELPAADAARPDTSGACAPREAERERPLSRFSTRREASRTMAFLMQSPDGSGQFVAPGSPAGEPRAKPSRKATRRGPMDEMRQLVRILVKIIPHSAGNIRACEEGGGGNRISEDQIKTYLSSTLGEAPRPQWGVPEGWGTYLAGLFSWVAARPITADEAQRCAKRDPGRSWEAIDSELATLGLLPATWPLPLTRAGLAAALVPAAQGAAAPARSGGSPAHKHAAEGPLMQAEVKRPRASPSAPEELSLWSDALEAVNAAAARSGSRSPGRAAAIARIKAEIQAKVQGSQLAMPLLLAPQPPTLVPVSVCGAGGELQTAYQLQMPPAPGCLSQQPPPCLGGELPASLDSGVGLSLSQVLLSQPGSSAFQAVKPASPLQGTHGLLEPPPPLRLSPLGRSPPSEAGAPASPSTDSDDGGAAFHPSRLASPRAHPAAGVLFKPTALKSDASQPLELPCGQGDARARPGSPAAAAAHEQPAAAAQPPVLGFLANGTFLPLGALPPASQSLALPAMQAQGSGPLAPASGAGQQQPWVPNLSASLS